MGSKIEFVPVQTTHRPDGDIARKFVRSTAMRRFRHQQRLERIDKLGKVKGHAAEKKKPDHPEDIAPSPCRSRIIEPEKIERTGPQLVVWSNRSLHTSDVPDTQNEVDSVDQLYGMSNVLMSPCLELDIRAFDAIESCLIETHKSSPFLFKHCKTYRTQISNLGNTTRLGADQFSDSSDCSY